ncbi:hypothetical protein JW935_14240 [candidate division KSB1 bacterium]|nr:hypothetical protein [candidate division KSB1 bacterium]
MPKKLKIIHLFLFSSMILSCGLYQILSIPRINNIHYGIPPGAELKNKYRASDGTTWSLISSDYFGFPELWLTHSKDGKRWSWPIYTAIPVQNGSYAWEIEDSTLVIVLKGYSTILEIYHYSRENMDTCGDTCFISLHDLLSDIDNDGLTDLAEWALQTDPLRQDTDGDSMLDARDKNPLAPLNRHLLPEEKLHKFIIDATIEQFDSDKIILVEQYNKKSIEYTRKRGFVLNLSPEAIKTFVDSFGYGVPILRAQVTQIDEDYRVEFEFFISPQDAWGYTAVYIWSESLEEWIHKETVESWES